MTVLHPVRVRPVLPPTRIARVRNAVVRRALPMIAASAAALVATLAVERALRQIAMGAAGRLGTSGALTAHGGSEFAIRTVVTEVTVIERIRRRA